MKFTQRYNIFEYGFGTQWISIIVSDSYSDILDSGIGNTTDIINLDTVKRDLNIEEGKFAIDALSFDINQISCFTTNDKNCLEFCKQSSNINNQRYIAVFMGDIVGKTSTEMLDIIDFFGRIDSKISGDDVDWMSDNHESSALPKRAYKFNAFSYDISVLDQCKIKAVVQKPDGTTINNISARFGSDSIVQSLGLFTIKDIYAHSTNKVCKAFPTGTLFSVLQQYLNAAQDLITDLTGTSLTFTLLDSDLGIDVSPAKFTLKNESSDADLLKSESDTTKKYRLKIASSTSGSGWVSAQIFRTMLNTELAHDLSSTYISPPWESEAIATQFPNCFQGQQTVSQILFEVARSFGMFLFAKQTGVNTFTIEFKSLGNIADSSYTYVTGVKEGSLDTSSVIANNATKFYSTANTYALDGMDTFYQKHSSELVDASSTLKYFKDSLDIDDKKNKTTSQRLLLSSGITAYMMNYMRATTELKPSIVQMFYLANSSCNTTSLSWSTIKVIRNDDANVFGSYGFMPEILLNGIWINTTPSATETTSLSYLGGSANVIKPIAAIYAKVGSENLEFKSLSEYANAISARSQQYYKTEYKWTVPFWNGFSSAIDRASRSWKNLKLGSRIKVTEAIKTLSSGVWSDATVNNDFIVVGYERNYKSPETKLTLHSSERFNYFQYNNDTIPTFGTTNTLSNTANVDDTTIVQCTADTGVTFAVGDAVTKLSSGLVVRSIANNAHYGKVIGICTSQSGDTVQVQTSGRFIQNAFDFTVGNPVFVRTNGSGFNVSQTFLTGITGSEDTVIYLGHADTPDSFFIEIESFIYS